MASDPVNAVPPTLELPLGPRVWLEPSTVSDGVGDFDVEVGLTDGLSDSDGLTDGLSESDGLGDGLSDSDGLGLGDVERQWLSRSAG